MSWRFVAPLTFCVLVFFFALHAKTAVYAGATPVKITPATASKMWMSGQKLDVRPVQSTTAPLFWLILNLSAFGFYLHRRLWVRSTVIVRSSNALRLWQLRRFLRPPPVA